MITRRLTIGGRVQGVGFRYALADEARARQLCGWVRNLRDGSVEAVLAGPEADVEAVIAWAHRGPPAARVTAVAVEPATTDAREFAIVTTA
ncbi:MAG TPA: acylphosphatase [Casimicrobiaceae bacterium]|jgi:acylphosphatase|nr:acylphosphatase [Casimicrobiaceae bacterium]